MKKKKRKRSPFFMQLEKQFIRVPSLLGSFESVVLVTLTLLNRKIQQIIS